MSFEGEACISKRRGREAQGEQVQLDGWYTKVSRTGVWVLGGSLACVNWHGCDVRGCESKSASGADGAGCELRCAGGCSCSECFSCCGYNTSSEHENKAKARSKPTKVGPLTHGWSLFVTVDSISLPHLVGRRTFTDRREWEDHARKYACSSSPLLILPATFNCDITMIQTFPTRDCIRDRAGHRFHFGAYCCRKNDSP